LVPAKSFIDAIPHGEEVIPGPFCVQAAATVEEVIEKIVMTKSHRVYVVDVAGHPIGVVSLVDLLKVVLENL
jgi:CBS domain-containing protein